MWSHLETKNTTSVSIARQPVFDDKRKLWGYELFCVGLPEESSVAISVQSSAYVCLQQMMEKGKKIIVDFSEKSVLENLPYALPPVLAAVKVMEHAAQSPSVMEVLRGLKSDRYLIAVGDFSGNPACAPLYEMADIVNIDAANKGKDALTAGLTQDRQYKASLLATRI